MANINWLKQARVQVPHRSGFDKSFRNLLTAKVGTLVPVLCDELIPGSRVNLRQALQAQLPPLASDTFMRCKIKLEAFFVPNRLMYGGYEAWLTGDKLYDDGVSSFVDVSIPYLQIEPGSAAAAQTNLLKPGTLADYLGFKLLSSDVAGLQNDSSGYIGGTFNIFPFLGYHLIWDSWYRNTKVQQKLFTRPSQARAHSSLYYLPYQFIPSGGTAVYKLNSLFNDGSVLGDLRQRNFGSDYFTEATPQAQQGSPQKVTIDANDQFSISALRAANSIQQWLERNNLAGFRLQDYVRANYGASLSDGVAQRPLFLGMDEVVVYNKGVEQNAGDTSTSASSNNPFKNVGARYGNAYATGNGTLADDFVANEPGYLYVIASLVPHVTYSTGILRQNLRYAGQNTQSDLATPLLQNVGNQPIYSKEVAAVNAFSVTYVNQVFGYIDRYADFMTREDELHGILRDGESLQSFALQRSLTLSQTISNSFLKIPTNFMDQVTAVDESISEYGYWLDIYFDYKVSMPLAEFCQPSLQDPAYEHGKEVVVRRSGSRL